MIAAPHKPLSPVAIAWRWISRPVRPSPKHPQGFSGLLEIVAERSTGKLATEVYVTAPILDPRRPVVLGWSLTKANGTRYDVRTNETYWSCDCAAATFDSERGPCKHAAALKEALPEIPTPKE